MDKLSKRKNIRLEEYDYSEEGFYFITICTKDKKDLFWNVGETFGRQFEKWSLSKIGKAKELQEIIKLT